MSSPHRKLPPDENRGPMVLQISGVLDAASLFVLLLRLYTRLVVKKAAGFDDVLATLAWVGLTIGMAFNCLQVQNGFGRHVEYLSKREIIGVGKWTLANEIQITFSLTFLKLSACVFILRMMHNVQSGVRYSIYFLSTLLSVLATISILALCLQCFPLEHFYNRSVPGKCISSEAPQRIFQAYAIVGTVIDLSYVVLPIIVLRGVQMNSSVKYSLFVLLALVLFPAAASIVKIVLTDYEPEDIPWDLVNVEIWNILEGYIGVIIASLPAIRPLFQSIRTSLSRYATSKLALRHSKGSDWTIARRKDNQSSDENVVTALPPPLPGHIHSGSYDHLVPMQNFGIGKRTEIHVEPEHV